MSCVEEGTFCGRGYNGVDLLRDEKIGTVRVNIMSVIMWNYNGLHE